MPSLTVRRPTQLPLLLALLAGATIALLVTATAASAASKRVAEKAENQSLGEIVLTNLRGHTLYSLSAEKHGRFICANPGCLASWRPLLIPRGVKPKGPVPLGTIKRPNGKFQVTYKGLPLYRFVGDAKAGEANGEGFKDVGTWHAASLGKLSTSPPPETQPQPPSYPPSTPPSSPSPPPYTPPYPH
jgi:predicted lipoprotein with Yx(FWY)xxD motif